MSGYLLRHSRPWQRRLLRRRRTLGRLLPSGRPVTVRTSVIVTTTVLVTQAVVVCVLTPGLGVTVVWKTTVEYDTGVATVTVLVLLTVPGIPHDEYDRPGLGLRLQVSSTCISPQDRHQPLPTMQHLFSS